MEERLRRSASFWRGVAGAALVLGIIGSIIIAVVVARGPYGDEFDAGVFFTILIPSVFGLMLSLGVFFMISRIMDGLAELIGYGGHLPAVTGTSVASAVARSSSPHWIGRPREQARHTRRCPNCAKFIDHDLETCPHCQADLRVPVMGQPAEAPQPERPLLPFFGPKSGHTPPAAPQDTGSAPSAAPEEADPPQPST
jgi:hypothetical protein